YLVLERLDRRRNAARCLDIEVVQRDVSNRFDRDRRAVWHDLGCCPQQHRVERRATQAAGESDDGQNPLTYGSRWPTDRTSSNLSSSIIVGSHLPWTNASRTAVGIDAEKEREPAVMRPVSTFASMAVSGDCSMSVCSFSMVA